MRLTRHVGVARRACVRVVVITTTEPRPVFTGDPDRRRNEVLGIVVHTLDVVVVVLVLLDVVGRALVLLDVRVVVLVTCLLGVLRSRVRFVRVTGLIDYGRFLLLLVLRLALSNTTMISTTAMPLSQGIERPTAKQQAGHGHCSDPRQSSASIHAHNNAPRAECVMARKLPFLALVHAVIGDFVAEL